MRLHEPGNYKHYRVATLSTLYLTVSGIIIPNWKSMLKSKMRATRYVRKNGRNDPNFRKVLLLNNFQFNQ